MKAMSVERVNVQGSDTLTPVELKALLYELHQEGSWFEGADEDGDDGSATVAAVAEATGHSLRYVWEILSRLRHEDAEIRLSRVIRELEEPLFRVERPGHTPTDPLARHFRNGGESLSPILDEIVAREAEKKTRKPSGKVGMDAPEKATQIAANIVLFLFLVLFIGTVFIGIVKFGH